MQTWQHAAAPPATGQIPHGLGGGGAMLAGVGAADGASVRVLGRALAAVGAALQRLRSITIAKSYGPDRAHSPPTCTL
jgi:hypothetical protein